MLIIRKYIFNFERISFAVSRGPKVFLGVHYFSVQSGTTTSSSSFSAMTHRVPRTHTIAQTLDPLARLVLVRKRRAGGKMFWQLLRRAITELWSTRAVVYLWSGSIWSWSFMHPTCDCCEMIILEADYEKICCCLLKGRAAHTSRQLESFETAAVYFLAISRKWKSPFHINIKNRFIQNLLFPISPPVPAVLMT